MTTKIKGTNLDPAIDIVTTGDLTVADIVISGTITGSNFLTNTDTDSVSEGSTNLYYTDARVDTRLSSGSVGNIVTTGYLRGPASFVIDPAAHGDNTGTVVIAGNLQVDGLTTTIKSTTLTVDDLNIVLASGAVDSAAANGAGITVAGASASLTYVHSGTNWSFNKPLNVTGTVTADGIELDSNDQYILAGAGSGLKIGHDASSSIIRSQVGPMYIDGNGITFRGYSPYTKHMDIATNGDVSFYEDTGADAKMFWDASHESLSLGDVGSSTDRRLNISGSGPQTATTQFGVVVNPTMSNDVTGSIYNIYSQANVASGASLTNLYSLYIGASGLNSSTVTNVYGLYQEGASEKNYFAGNVGIGTLLPETMLDVRNSSTALYTSNMSGTGSYVPSSSDMIQVRNTHTGLDDIYAGIWFETGTGATNTTGSDRAGRIALVVDNDSAYSSNFVFQTRSADAQLTEKMRITQNGNVGIGTNIPNQLLHVKGASPFTRIESNSTSYNGLSMVNASGNFYFGIDDTGGNFYGDASARAIYSDGAYPIVFYTNATKRVVIDATGKTGIGNDSPTYDLDVTGQGRFTTDLRLGSENLRLSTDGSGEFGLGYGTTHTTANRFRVYQNTTPVFSVRDDGAIDTTQVRHSIRPSLNLDFANSKELDSRITFYRDSIATYYDSKGVLKYANVNEPRFDHDPVTGESKGLLIEEARTNISRSTLNHGILGYLNCFGIPNVTIAPDGSHTALLVQNIPSPTSVTCVFINALSGVSAGQVYTCSIYLKAGPNPDPSIWAIYDGLTSVNYGSTNISWSNGVPTATNNAVVTSVGNGWYRISVVATVPAGKTDMLALLYPSSGGAGNKNVYCWGSQFELGAFATSYIPITLTFTSRASNATYHDETGILRTAPVNGARYGYKYDGRKWVETGLILENAATNILWYVDSGLGSNWPTDVGNVASRYVFGQEFFPVGDSTSDGDSPSFPTGGALTSGVNYCVSIYVDFNGTADDSIDFALVGFASDPLVNYRRITWSSVTKQFTLNGTVNGLWTHVSQGYEEVSPNIYRIWAVGTPGQSMSSSRIYMFPASTNTTAFYVGMPQIEQGNFPSSYISTHGVASATRSADVASSVAYTRNTDVAYIDDIQNSDWYDGADSGATIYAEGRTVFDTGITDECVFVDFHSGTSTDEIRLYHRAGTSTINFINDGGNDVILNSGIHGGNNYHKMAGAMALNDFAFSVDGGTTLSDVSNGPSLDTLTTMGIGGGYTSAITLSGHIKKISYYPERLTNAELQALTENN